MGNVLSVISDNKIGVDSDIDLVADYYEPYIVSESDYYPYGMTMEKRSFASSEYRFGFNTQEKSTELGEDSYTAEFWQYDAKIARRWNVDPVNKPNESSYLTFGGNPVYLVDILGDNAGDYYKKDENGKLFLAGNDGIDDDKVYVQNDDGNVEHFGKNYYEVLGGQTTFNGDYNEGSLYVDDDFEDKIGGYLEGAKRKFHEYLSTLSTDRMNLEELDNAYGNLVYVGEESWEGELDFKYDIANIALTDRNRILPTTKTLYLIGDKYYNVNGAGNFIWGQYTKLAKVDYWTVNVGPDIARYAVHVLRNFSFLGYESDPPHEVEAIKNGYDWVYDKQKYEKKSWITH